MKINFDTKNDIMRIKFQEGEYKESREIEEGIIVDITKDDKVMAIEIIDVSKKMPKNNLKEFSMNISD